VFEVIILGVFFGTLLYLIYNLNRGRSMERMLPMLIMMLVMVIIVLPMMTTIMEELPRLVQNSPDCIQEEWVDCELYNIPLDECEKDVTEEGPFYDVRTITKYTKHTCTKWDDGTVLKPRGSNE